MPTIYDVLEKDHRHVSTLFEAILDGTGQTRSREDLFKELKDALLLHAKTEEKVFYDALKPIPEAKALIPAAEAEHHEVESQLKAISKLSSTSPDWEFKVRALQQAVLAHVRQEEGTIFTVSKKYFNEQQVTSMGQQVEAQKAKALGAGADIPR